MNIDIWRKELWHPVTVHFPLVLLLGATANQTAAMLADNQNRPAWQTASSITLLLGVATAWLSLYTGDLADGIVARTICDPTELKDHEITARAMTYTFTVAAILQQIVRWIITPRLRRFTNILVLLILITGTCLLIKAGHLGASVVYQQGGGVAGYPQDCD